MTMYLGNCRVKILENFIEITNIVNDKVNIVNEQKVVFIEETDDKQNKYKFIIYLNEQIIIHFECDAESASKIKRWVYNI